MRLLCSRNNNNNNKIGSNDHSTNLLLKRTLLQRSGVLFAIVFTGVFYHLEIDNNKIRNLQWMNTIFTNITSSSTTSSTSPTTTTTTTPTPTPTLESSSESSPFVCPQEPCHLSIGFMGDSLSRFIYYSLVYYLRHGKWIDPTSTPNLVKPADFVGGYELDFDWLPWYNASTAALHPYESCDCFRQAGDPSREPGRNTIIENRYYYDPHRNNTIFYIQAFGSHIPIRGHWDIDVGIYKGRAGDGATTTTSTKGEDHDHHNNNNNTSMLQLGPKQKHEPFAWNYGNNDWAGAIRDQVSKVKPEYLVLNAGKWPNKEDFLKPDSFGGNKFVNNIMKAIQDGNMTSTTKVIWRTITSGRGGTYWWGWNQIDQVMCRQSQSQRSASSAGASGASVKNGGTGSFFDGCFNVSYWTKNLESKYYVDGHHFVEPIYRKINELFFMDFLGLTLGGGSNNDDYTPISWEELGLNSTPPAVVGTL